MVQTTEAGCGRGREGMVDGKEGTVVEWDGGVGWKEYGGELWWCL